MKSLFLRRALCAGVAAAACLGTFAPARVGAVARHRQTYQRAATVRRASTTPKLSYYGGRILTHVKVDVVVWNSWSYSSSVKLAGPKSISSFFSGITASSYIDWLTEYNTPTQKIGRGTLDGVYTVHPPAADNGSVVTSAQIADGLKSLIRAGVLPKPSTTRLYAVFFRSGEEVSTPFGNSTDDFCAYHDSFASGSSTVYLAVIPYEVANRGCKPSTTAFNNVTTIISHELVESITDPGVGINKVAWYDQANGEIGDICAGISRPATVAGSDGVRYMVQREWSNRSSSCIVTR